MKKTEPESSKSAPNPASSPRSVASSSLATPASPTASFPRPPVLDVTARTICRLSDEDLARWGAYAIEDLGIIEIDKVVGQARPFGAAIRAELFGSPNHDYFSFKWEVIANRVHRFSPSTESPGNMVAVLCQLAATQLFLEGNLNAGT